VARLRRTGPADRQAGFLVRHQVGDTLKREKIGLMGPDLGVDEARRQAVLILGGYARDEAAAEPALRRAARKEVAPEPTSRACRRSLPSVSRPRGCVQLKSARQHS